MKNFKDLLVWQKSHHLILSVYKITELMPEDEPYNLPSQLRRAAALMPANIAESRGKFMRQDIARYLKNARCSAQSLQSLLRITNELGYGERELFETTNQYLNEVKAMVSSLLKKVRRE
jgi:four helix bundle protein